MLHMQFEIPGAFPPLKDGHGQKQILPPICHRKKIWIYKNRMPYSKSHLKQQRSQKKWTQVAQFLEIFSQKIILTQPAMVSLWALHGTGRELLLSSTSLQDFWLENISSAQYFKISVQPSLSHLSHFEEKSPLVLWQELRSTGSPRWARTGPQWIHSLSVSFQCSQSCLWGTAGHLKGQPDSTRKLCR